MNDIVTGVYYYSRPPDFDKPVLAFLDNAKIMTKDELAAISASPSGWSGRMLALHDTALN